MADKSRLEKLVGMLGSDHEGEVLAAVRFIRKMADDEKKTIRELLTETLGTERVVIKERPREAQEDRHPATKPFRHPPNRDREYRWDGFRRSYEGAWQSSREEEPQGFSRTILDEIRAIHDTQEPKDCLDLGMQDFVNSVPFQYEWDYQLTIQQKRFARIIIKTWKRRNAEPLI